MWLSRDGRLFSEWDATRSRNYSSNLLLSSSTPLPVSRLPPLPVRLLPVTDSRSRCSQLCKMRGQERSEWVFGEVMYSHRDRLTWGNAFVLIPAPSTAAAAATAAGLEPAQLQCWWREWVCPGVGWECWSGRNRGIKDLRVLSCVFFCVCIEKETDKQRKGEIEALMNGWKLSYNGY